MDGPSTSCSGGAGRLQTASHSNGKRTNNRPVPYARRAAETCARDVLRQYRIGKRDECTLWYRCPASWTAEMVGYYTTIDVSQRTFDCATALRKIREEHGWSASDWTVREPVGAARRAAPKCDVCGRVGHAGNGCEKRKRPDVCAMCGDEGHDRNGCGRSACLSCGTPQPEFVDSCEFCEPRRRCVGCREYGHGPKRCPENWRRFHDVCTSAAAAAAERDAPAAEAAVDPCAPSASVGGGAGSAEGTDDGPSSPERLGSEQGD